MRNRRLAKLEMQLPVLIKKEGDAYVAYTPALDISTYGETQSKAKKNFNELVEIFFEEFVDNPDGLSQVLESLGWKKQTSGWKPPKITNTIQNVEVSLAA